MSRTIRDGEEYQQKWEYVRHTETMRAHIVQWYVVVGTVSAFVLKDVATEQGF